MRVAEGAAARLEMFDTGLHLRYSTAGHDAHMWSCASMNTLPLYGDLSSDFKLKPP